MNQHFKVQTNIYKFDKISYIAKISLYFIVQNISFYFILEFGLIFKTKFFDTETFIINIVQNINLEGSWCKITCFS